MCLLGWWPTCLIWVVLVLLRSEGASVCKPGLPSGRQTEDSRAVSTQNYPWWMARDSGDFTASWVFHRDWGSAPDALLPVFFFFSSSAEGWQRALAGACGWGEVVTAGTAFKYSFLLWLLIITLSPKMKILVISYLTGSWWREISKIYHNRLSRRYWEESSKLQVGVSSFPAMAQCCWESHVPVICSLWRAVVGNERPSSPLSWVAQLSEHKEHI